MMDGIKLLGGSAMPTPNCCTLLADIVNYYQYTNAFKEESGEEEKCGFCQESSE